MRIEDHRLIGDDLGQVTFAPSPNVGGVLRPEYLVLHFTAGRSLESSVRWLSDPAAQASAHLVIGRQGEIVQLVPFDRVAWHAGVSEWLGRTGVNRFSIGIELDNAGAMSPTGDLWRAWFGDIYPADQVLVATHKHGGGERGWHAFTPEQLDAALAAGLAIVRHYQLSDVLGHEDVSPGRKTDPGPAFPMQSYRGRLFGRQEDEAPAFVTAEPLNVRNGPGIQHARILPAPLPAGVRVQPMERPGVWWRVQVASGPAQGLEGWVHSRYLQTA